MSCILCRCASIKPSHRRPVNPVLLCRSTFRSPWRGLPRQIDYSFATLPGMVGSAVDSHGRNVIEIEGSGVPVDMLESSWDDFVFISTIGHPLDRVVSSLKLVESFNEVDIQFYEWVEKQSVPGW